MKHVLILGATSGIASALAYKLASSEKCKLILAGRHPEEVEKLASDLRIRCDVETFSMNYDAIQMDSHEEFWQKCLMLMDIDTVILCYGYLGEQKLGEVNMAEAKAIIDVNFTSCVSILSLVAAYMEEKGRGTICAISSVAGDRGRQSNYLYGSAKGALALYLQGLRNRLSKSGVHVLTIKPGFVDTKMTYGQTGMFLVAKPSAVANDIYRAMKKKKNTLYTPFFWRWIMLIIKIIPENVFAKMNL
ncbi:SDR family oxidoreductase [Paenibacillus sp. KS-LC4]|uniref:SDR family oxidoreductase n=1 Tax=Paenibacillus sp. KS-LC4 TaxID=2979727 RepID=UPI0030CC5C5F